MSFIYKLATLSAIALTEAVLTACTDDNSPSTASDNGSDLFEEDAEL